MKKFFLFPLLFSVSFLAAQQAQLLVGTFTKGKSEGIYVFNFNTATGEAQQLSVTKASNPAFLTVSPDQQFVYSVNEDAPGQLSAYRFDKTNGSLHLINRQSSHGDSPCYITIDKKGKWVIAGNYSSGTLALYKVLPDGGLDTAKQVIEHNGYGMNTERQQGPHVHATVLSAGNKQLYVPDLGIDKVMIYDFDAKKGLLKEHVQPFVMTEPGSGPRHFAIHPHKKFAYLMEELTGTVSAFKIAKDGSLSLLETTSALPRDFMGVIGSADIHVSPDGKFLYASNRGESNTIAIFKINPKTGKPIWAGAQSTLGKKPRNFNFDPTGNFLLVANQDSDEIVVFRRDLNTGLLTDTGKRIAVPSPVCVQWVK